MIKHATKILKKEWLNSKTFSLEFNIENIHPSPGQFFQIQVNGLYEPLLNRPMSIASYRKNKVLLIIKVVGKGSEILSRKKVGDELVLFGPLGKRIIIKKKRSLLIAGGIGVAPLYFLAQELFQQHIDFTFIYGAKTPEELVLKKGIEKIAPHKIFITEYKSKKKGTALSALKEMDIKEYELCYACGPKAMLKELKSMSLHIPVYAFYEDFLGCGCGLCLGCGVKYYGVYKRICEDGPVFELKGIEFE